MGKSNRLCITSSLNPLLSQQNISKHYPRYYHCYNTQRGVFKAMHEVFSLRLLIILTKGRKDCCTVSNFIITTENHHCEY